ncbi:hypothetical protein J2S54_002818 [Streptomyces sp. DSM 42143]|uniref:hypothetical protein n=1 Tax=Streptomyces sp. DSM 42143 TaxID=2817711 RepID=UPI00278612B6|nr:hypothetical protein [Streptomyces sp. DSM 42143]MDQ0385998.1 hypothetical protein [Streptomyces sp. DSM 42143]
MDRFRLTEWDRAHVDNARRELAAARTLDMTDDRAIVRTLGRLEVALARLVEMVDASIGEDLPPCPAAHPEDLTPCSGPVVVTILDTANAGADGCERHAARLLASLAGGRPVAKPDAPAGVELRIFRAAHHMPPYPWREDRP